MAFAVATPVFEGPFDLLLHLILREQVDIYEVSLSRIVDAYLAACGQSIGPPVVASLDRDFDRIDGVTRIGS